MNTFWILIATTAVSLAYAGEEGTGHYYGHIQSSTPVVMVKNEGGKIVKYEVSSQKINDASLDIEYNRVQLHQHAKTASCTKFLGYLAADFKVSIGAQTNEGDVFANKTAFIKASGGDYGVVKVYGSCDETTLEPSQIHIEAEKGDLSI